MERNSRDPWARGRAHALSEVLVGITSWCTDRFAAGQPEQRVDTLW